MSRPVGALLPPLPVATVGRARITCAQTALEQGWSATELADTLAALGIDEAGLADGLNRGAYRGDSA